MKLAFVLPKYGVSLDDPCIYPLGFMYVASWMKRKGHEVKVFNANLWDDIDLAAELPKFDQVYMTGGRDFLPHFERVSELHPFLVLGGALATHAPEEARDIAWRIHRGEIEYGDIDRYPWPDYEAFEIDEYHRRHARRYMGVLLSRGCPHRCSFCAHTCEYRERDLNHVEDEIRYYKSRWKIDTVVLNDNTLNVTKSRFLAVCDLMKRLGLLWTAAIRADVFDAEMADAAKASGADYFVVGVESFDRARLQKMRKGVTPEQIRRTLDLLEERQIRYHGNVLVGLDGDTMEDAVSEVVSIPREYHVFPALVQNFAGVRAEPALSPEERRLLVGTFAKYAESRGMGVYPSV